MLRTFLESDIGNQNCEKDSIKLKYSIVEKNDSTKRELFTQKIMREQILNIKRHFFNKHEVLIYKETHFQNVQNLLSVMELLKKVLDQKKIFFLGH